MPQKANHFPPYWGGAGGEAAKPISMLKAEVNIVGTIKRDATVRTDKDYHPYVSFIMTVNLPDAKTGTKDVDIYVSLPNSGQNEAANYVAGLRVAVNGSLDIRKKEDALNFYLTANFISTDEVEDDDSIKGSLTFRGHLKKDNVYEQKTDKKGNPFIVFSAYSAEKVGDGFVSTWVNFLRYPEKDAAIETVIPEWMRSKARVDIKGDLQVSAYGGNIKLGCRVKEMSEYVYVQQ